MRESPWNAETIKKARETWKLSRAELGERLGCGPETITEWEEGIHKPMNAYSKLLSFFFAGNPKSIKS